MNKLLLLLTVLLVIFIYVDRERLYLRDPLAKVTRDGVANTSAKAMINFSNDVLLRGGVDGRQRVYLAQSWDDKVIAPAEMKCLGAMICLADGDHVAGAPVVAGSRGKREPYVGVTMTDRRVEFVDEDGALVQVVLR